MHEIFLTFFISIGQIIGCPAGCLQIIEIGISESINYIFRGDAPGSAIGKGGLRFRIKHHDQSFQKSCVGIVIGFCNPDILSASQPHTLIPLLERAA